MSKSSTSTNDLQAVEKTYNSDTKFDKGYEVSIDKNLEKYDSQSHECNLNEIQSAFNYNAKDSKLDNEKLAEIKTSVVNECNSNIKNDKKSNVSTKIIKCDKSEPSVDTFKNYGNNRKKKTRSKPLKYVEMKPENQNSIKTKKEQELYKSCSRYQKTDFSKYRRYDFKSTTKSERHQTSRKTFNNIKSKSSLASNAENVSEKSEVEECWDNIKNDSPYKNKNSFVQKSVDTPEIEECWDDLNENNYLHLKSNNETILNSTPKETIHSDIVSDKNKFYKYERHGGDKNYKNNTSNKYEFVKTVSNLSEKQSNSETNTIKNDKSRVHNISKENFDRSVNFINSSSNICSDNKISSDNNSRNLVSTDGILLKNLTITPECLDDFKTNTCSSETKIMNPLNDNYSNNKETNICNKENNSTIETETLYKDTFKIMPKNSSCDEENNLKILQKNNELTKDSEFNPFDLLEKNKLDIFCDDKLINNEEKNNKSEKKDKFSFMSQDIRYSTMVNQKFEVEKNSTICDMAELNISPTKKEQHKKRIVNRKSGFYFMVCTESSEYEYDSNEEEIYEEPLEIEKFKVIGKRFCEKYDNLYDKYFDTHCHIDYMLKQYGITSYEKFLQIHKYVIPNSYAGCLAVFCDPLEMKNYENSLWNEVLKMDNIYGAVGCHPKKVRYFRRFHETAMEKMLLNPKCVALGEIGLDFSTLNSNNERALQIKVLGEQVKMAKQFNKPLVIHARDAHREIVDELLKLGLSQYKMHLHCFVGSVLEMNEWLDSFPKSFIGFTPLLTNFDNKRSQEIRECVKTVPLEKLLLETDAPFFVPYEFKWCGMKTSLPPLAITVAGEIAKLRKIDINIVLSHCKKNVYDMYGIVF